MDRCIPKKTVNTKQMYYKTNKCIFPYIYFGKINDFKSEQFTVTTTNFAVRGVKAFCW